MPSKDYDLELEKVSAEITRRNAKSILIQLGEGLKPRADEIQDFLEKHNPGISVNFWLNSCYGRCDIPEILHGKGNKFDLLVQFGH